LSYAAYEQHGLANILEARQSTLEEAYDPITDAIRTYDQINDMESASEAMKTLSDIAKGSSLEGRYRGL